MGAAWSRAAIATFLSLPGSYGYLAMPGAARASLEGRSAGGAAGAPGGAKNMTTTGRGGAKFH